MQIDRIAYGKHTDAFRRLPSKRWSEALQMQPIVIPNLLFFLMYSSIAAVVPIWMEAQRVATQQFHDVCRHTAVSVPILPGGDPAPSLQLYYRSSHPS